MTVHIHSNTLAYKGMWSGIFIYSFMVTLTHIDQSAIIGKGYIFICQVEMAGSLNLDHVTKFGIMSTGSTILC